MSSGKGVRFLLFYFFLNFAFRAHAYPVDDMRLGPITTAMLPLAAKAVNIVQSNDDGWAEINLREFYYSLTDAGFNSFISAPADNESGTSSLDEPPKDVGDDGCEFDSCPPGSPPTGKNSSMPRFHVSSSC